jgi:hypothetical protein
MEWRGTAPQTFLAVILLGYLWLIGTHMETAYPETLIESYSMPLTRMGLLGLVLLTAAWSPTAGILAALAFVCLGADVTLFTKF